MVIVSQHNITMCRLHHVHHHNATMQTNWLRLVWTLKYYLYVSITAIKTNYRSVYSINIAHSVSDAAACHAMPNDAQNMHIFVVLFVFELIWRLVWDDNHLPTCWSLSVICERARARSRRGIRSNWIWKQEKQFESTSDECVCLTFYWAFFSVSMAILSMHALQYVCTDLDLTDGDISSRARHHKDPFCFGIVITIDRTIKIITPRTVAGISPSSNQPQARVHRHRNRSRSAADRKWCRKRGKRAPNQEP